ncbi:hypothetical protein PROFUN_03389 [Planoprotostelium fungivorum]|uniref:LIM zinc-binding domain-containing protein n=1 Tax=Planoprotostelium fungivorum TaxID=1890364 RepID=A0A2P6NWE6_9EUKA|nr:hypothetical protein PROFUN_03389 [Planoprotostelium fungivorum]
MSTKCYRCGKTVYAAEKQSYDGADFHGLCLVSHKKENMKPKLLGVYAGDEDRVAGQLNSSSIKQTPAAGAVNFCGECGTKAGTGNFCSKCGNKLNN